MIFPKKNCQERVGNHLPSSFFFLLFRMASSEPTTIQQALQVGLPKILAAIPAERRGTTFKNQVLLGRAEFCAQLRELLLSKRDAEITGEDLVALGNAEDYLRVSSNVSSLLEFSLAVRHGVEEVSGVF